MLVLETNIFKHKKTYTYRHIYIYIIFARCKENEKKNHTAHERTRFKKSVRETKKRRKPTIYSYYYANSTPPHTQKKKNTYTTNEKHC